MSNEKLLIEKPFDDTVHLILNRPEVHNALDEELISALHEALISIENDPKVRLVIIKANGKSFSAGADLSWMKSMINYSENENKKEAEKLALMLDRLNSLSKPTIAIVQGAAFGGAIGLIACCDIAIAVEKAEFCFSEVKLGLIPAVISPYVIAAIGQRAARHYFITAEHISANQAKTLGLLTAVVDKEQLFDKAEKYKQLLLRNGPKAIANSKKLILEIANKEISEITREYTTQCIADSRVSNEGQEGMQAFLEKRKPNWIVS